TAVQLKADLAPEARRGERPQSVTVRAWPPTPPVDEDEDWDAVIARAKMQAAASPRVTRRPQPAPPSHLPPELQVTPPPVLVRQAPAVAMGQLHSQRIRTVEEVRAKLDAIVWGSANRPAARRPPPAARRTAEDDMLTPPPVGRAGGSVRPRPRR
ncbi:MAG TPA: hypothetical protein VN962_20020, partial [Polyangia bacterium]|nr:hypothetical protein [Polyangia bacterium]